MKFGFYSNKVRFSSSIQRYKMVLKFVVKAAGFEKVIMILEKLIQYIIEGAHLVGHNKKPSSLIYTSLRVSL